MKRRCSICKDPLRQRRNGKYFSQCPACRRVLHNMIAAHACDGDCDQIPPERLRRVELYKTVVNSGARLFE